MLEASGDLWEQDGGVVVITTNGVVRTDGACVMGRGCARQAKDRWPDLPFYLGRLIRRHGNRVFYLGVWGGIHIASMPVKSHWREAADVSLIERSAHQLVQIADGFGWSKVWLPRPGCGNGRLSWDDVRSRLEVILDDRFTAMTI